MKTVFAFQLPLSGSQDGRKVVVSADRDARVFQLPLSGSRVSVLQRDGRSGNFDFQLPLSGSHLRIAREIDRSDTELSTPSLGITRRSTGS